MSEQEESASANPAPAEEQKSAAAAEGETKKEEVVDTNTSNNKTNGQQRNNNKKDDKPIEELYDLSKPIPKVPKPNKDEHEKQLAELTVDIDKAKEERKKVQDKIESMLDKSKKTGIGKEHDELKKLRSKKGRLIDEKKAIRAKLDAAKNQADKIIKDKNSARATIKFTKLEDIEAEIKKLTRKQETISMSLSEEKKLIKEIDALQASKKLVEQLKEKEGSIEDIKEQRKNIGASIGAKDKEIDAVTKEIEEKQAKIKSMTDKETDKRDALQTLFKKRDECRKIMTDKIKVKDDLRAAFREKNNVWYNYQRAVKAQKKIQMEEEKKKREEEHQAWLKQKEEEEAKKIPYEEEQGLCDYLADYLTKTYLSDASNSGEQKKEDVVAVKDDPFAGMKALGKKGQDEEYFGKGKGKKKRVRTKKQNQAGAGPFKLSVDTFDQFGLLGLTPPTSVDMVEQSVKELKEKKEWYKQQPRGSVPTAAEIRKANEKSAAKIRHSTEQNGNSSSAPQSKKGGNKKDFSLKTDDFAPLGGAATVTTTTPLVSAWGKSSPATTGAAADPKPAEAAASDAKTKDEAQAS